LRVTACHSAPRRSCKGHFPPPCGCRPRAGTPQTAQQPCCCATRKRPRNTPRARTPQTPPRPRPRPRHALGHRGGQGTLAHALGGCADQETLAAAECGSSTFQSPSARWRESGVPLAHWPAASVSWPTPCPGHSRGSGDARTRAGWLRRSGDARCSRMRQQYFPSPKPSLTRVRGTAGPLACGERLLGPRHALGIRGGQGTLAHTPWAIAKIRRRSLQPNAAAVLSQAPSLRWRKFVWSHGSMEAGEEAVHGLDV